MKNKFFPLFAGFLILSGIVIPAPGYSQNHKAVIKKISDQFAIRQA